MSGKLEVCTTQYTDDFAFIARSFEFFHCVSDKANLQELGQQGLEGEIQSLQELRPI